LSPVVQLVAGRRNKTRPAAFTLSKFLHLCL